MKLYNYLIIFLLIASSFLLLFSCKEPIDLDSNSTYTKLMVEGYLSTDTTYHMVRLSKSSDAYHLQTTAAVSNAKVTITDGTTTDTLFEDISHPGFYFTQPTYYGMPGRTYTLNVKNVDINNDNVMEEYWAKSLLKDENPIDSFNIFNYKEDSHTNSWIFNLYAQDIGKGRNCYILKVKKNNKMLTDSTFKYSIADNTGFEGKYYTGFPVYWLRESADTTYNLYNGDTVTLEMYGITDEYYQFLWDFIFDYYPKIPLFSGPSADAYSNIEPSEKALGVFAAYSIQRKSIVYKPN